MVNDYEEILPQKLEVGDCSTIEFPINDTYFEGVEFIGVLDTFGATTGAVLGKSSALASSCEGGDRDDATACSRRRRRWRMVLWSKAASTTSGASSVSRRTRLT